MTSNAPLKFCALSTEFQRVHITTECISRQSAYHDRVHITAEIFQADCTKASPLILPDIIITDVPYGNLVEWNEASIMNIEEMMNRLWDISHEGTVLAICMDKKQKVYNEKWMRVEKNKKEVLGKKENICYS